jgi:hypothetical protein
MRYPVYKLESKLVKNRWQYQVGDIIDSVDYDSLNTSEIRSLLIDAGLIYRRRVRPLDYYDTDEGIVVRRNGGEFIALFKDVKLDKRRAW